MSPVSGIVHREVREPLLGLLEVADVACDEREALHVAVGILARDAEHGHRHQRVAHRDRELAPPRLPAEDVLDRGRERVVLAVTLGDDDARRGRVRPSDSSAAKCSWPDPFTWVTRQVGCDDEHQVGAGLQCVDEAVDVGARLDEVGDVGERDDHADRAGRAVLRDRLDADPDRRRAVAQAGEVAGRDRRW